jgi:antirestriction protein ArdC
MAKERDETPTRRDLYQEVTDKILALLDQGVPPWRQPITTADGPGMPTSFGTKKPYRGINLFLLAITSWAHDYASNYWLTFRQAKELGGSVRNGEKGSLVLFWKQHATKDRQSGEDVTIPVLRHYVVFNADQVEGLPKPDAPPPKKRLSSRSKRRRGWCAATPTRRRSSTAATARATSPAKTVWRSPIRSVSNRPSRTSPRSSTS